MFLMIPHSADVGWGRMPWLVFALMALCTAIYYAQYTNNAAIEAGLKAYCYTPDDPALDSGQGASLRSEPEYCMSVLGVMHQRPDKEAYREYMLLAGNEMTVPERRQRYEAHIADLFAEYEQVRQLVTPSLDAKLMTDPLSFNPWRAITSALAHGSWWHLIGNLIFFFAFAPTLEMVVGSRLRFAAAMVAIALITDLAYYGTVHLFDLAPLPTLGFSGVVMGMIGLSGYLVPNVRIRTFVWVLHFVRNVYLPAWLLAAWYIGWDAWYMITDTGSSGTNFIAHVFGGISGYLIGRFWFAGRKQEVADEVADEIEYRRARRADALGVLDSYKSRNRHSINADRELAARREFAVFVDQVYHAVESGNDALAINLLLSRYDEYRHAIELYEEIYAQMQTWRQTRTVLCLSRLLITEYIASRKYAKASAVAQRARENAADFAFAEPGQGELLAAVAQPISHQPR
jgi:Uncharacterized membrane protein (homolog of Drosophila rhomboid)